MNFDELQSAWHSDKGNDIVVPDSITKLRSVATPVQHIRSNMRKEFIVMLLLIVVIPFLPFVYGGKHVVAPAPFYSMYAALIILTAFYYIKFYLFYKRLDTATLTSKDSLYAVYYDIKLNIEMYRSFNYSVIPVLLLYQVMVITTLPPVQAAAFNSRLPYFIFLFSATFLFFIGLAILFVEFWIKYFYGKYLKQVKDVLEELKEE